MEKNWFTIKKLDINIYGIAEFDHFEKVISYLIVGKNKALLFDTGLGLNNIKKVVDDITKLPVIVINSHYHWDHIGGNGFFSNSSTFSRDRKTINIDPFELIIIKTPGHTPDSICLYEKRKNLLFSGDTFYPGSIYLHFTESNLNDYKKSIGKLSQLKIKWIFAGHNSFKSKPAILEKIQKKLKNIPKNKDVIRVSRTVSLKLR